MFYTGEKQVLKEEKQIEELAVEHVNTPRIKLRGSSSN